MHFGYICMSLSLWTISLLEPTKWVTITFTMMTVQAKSYEDILQSLETSEKLLFDITTAVDVAWEHATASGFIDPEILDKIGVELSPILYYKRDGGYYNEKDVGGIYPMSLSFQFDQRQFNSALPLTPNTISKYLQTSDGTEWWNVTVIFNMQDWSFPLSLRVVERMKKIISFYKSNWRSVKMGLELDGNVPKYDSLSPLISLVDVLILNIDIPPEEFILSYTAFKSNLRGKLDQHLNFVQKLVPHCPIYGKLNFPGKGNQVISLTEELYEKYYYYLLQFSVFWLNEGEREGLILQSFNSTLLLQQDMEGVNLKELLVPGIDSEIEGVKVGPCELKTMIDHVSSHFNRITLNIKDQDGNQHFDKVESPVCHPTRETSSVSDVRLKYRTNSDSTNLANLFAVINQTTNGIRWKLLETSQNVDEKLPLLVINLINETKTNLERKLRIPFYVEPVRYFNFKEVDEDIASLMWNKSTTLIWNILIPDLRDINASNLTRQLTLVKGRRQQFEKLFPEIPTILRVFYRNSYFYSWTHSNEGDVFCKPDLDYHQEFRENSEVLINFSRLHNISIEINDMLGYESTERMNWVGWSAIKTVDDLEMVATQLPAYVTRIQAGNSQFGISHTDPCISWTEEIPTEGMDVDEEFAGTTLYMRGMKDASDTISPEELEILLQFTLHKFSLVEIIPESPSNLETVLKVLSQPRLVKRLKDLGSKPGKIYLQIEYNVFLTNQQLFENLMVGIKPTGIHFLNWTNSQDTDDAIMHDYPLLRKLKVQGILVGIELEDCVKEVNNDFGNLKKSHMFPHVDYLLCSIKRGIEAIHDDKVWIARYLDTTLYIEKYFRRMFPNESQELFFRFNIEQGNQDGLGNEDSDFLKLLSDMSQYGSQYKMKLFMVPAFNDVRGRRCGWWSITNFGDLTNTSVFVEREARYLVEETWRPRQETVEGTSTSLIIAGLSTGVVSLIVAVLLIVVWYQRKFTLLTFEGHKFPRELEIPRSRFLLLNIIGKGNFGLVYKATLSGGDGEGSLSVAVKLPHPDCPKESFKCMLSELKVLPYVGSHPHVLKFIGAYIKEIGRGIAYIATELCENGALQEYLRSVCSQLELGGSGGIELQMLEPNIQELNRFAYEIALGMEFIAEKKILHSDLSTRNVLLDSHLKCKIADFGLSRQLYKSQEYIKKGTEVLPWKWLSIESLKRKEFTTKSDVWSYGVTLWEVFSLGSVPYPGLSWTEGFLEALENGVRMPAPVWATPALYDKMKECWDHNPVLRPTFTQLAQYFSSVPDLE